MSIDVLSLSHEDTRLKKEAYNEYSGPCPDMNCRCQTDGFRVRWNGTKWVFMCRGCWDSTEYLAERDRKRGWGDAISYLRHYRHMSFKQAKALADDGQEPSEMPEPAPRKGLDWRDRDWQDWRTEEMQCYKSQMPDSMALAYARERGLTDETIKTASFGFYEANDVPFLVIPSLNGGRIVTLMRRDLRPDIPSDKRWKEASGSTKELYLADSLARKLPTILCEDVFSALSVLQECGKDNINAGATCGADCCQDVSSFAWEHESKSCSLTTTTYTAPASSSITSLTACVDGLYAWIRVRIAQASYTQTMKLKF